MTPPPSRGSTDLSALIKAMVVLAAAVLLFAGFLRACSFAPGPPTVDRSSLRPVDAAQRLTAAARSVTFPVRVPTVPAGWVAQSSDVPTLPGVPDRAVRVGWLTPDDRFARLVQTSGTEEAAVRGEQGDPTARGAVQAGGRTWVVHTGVRGEAVWVTDLDGVRLLVTGSATPEALTALASAGLSGSRG